MPDTVFVIVETSFEYNDEFWFPSGQGNNDDVGVPIVAYKTLQRAEEELSRKTIEWLRAEDPPLLQIGDYEGPFGKNLKKVAKLLKLPLDTEGELVDEDEKYRFDGMGLKDHSDEVLNKIAGYLDFAPFKIVEIEVCDQ